MSQPEVKQKQPTKKVSIHTSHPSGSIFWGEVSLSRGETVIGTEVRAVEEGGGGIQCVIHTEGKR